ncbi:hypothetical protein ACHQM5_019739 [Ranunculus cassubicifolius]
MATESDLKQTPEISTSKPRRTRMYIMACSLISCGLHYMSLFLGLANDFSDIKFYFMSYTMALVKIQVLHSEYLKRDQILKRPQSYLAIAHLWIAIFLIIGCATQLPLFHGILRWGFFSIAALSTAEVLICIQQCRVDPHPVDNKKDIPPNNTASEENSVSAKASGFLLGGSALRKRTT